MASALQNLSKYDESTMPDASEMTFAVVVSEWNSHITHALYEGCYDTLVKHGANPEKIHTLQVPGAFELPAGARIITTKVQPDVVICLGCVIKGETDHDQYICNAVANALGSMCLVTGKAHIFGLITANNEQQALDRAGGKHGNKGVEAAVTAIRMAGVGKKTKEGKKAIGF